MLFAVAPDPLPPGENVWSSTNWGCWCQEALLDVVRGGGLIGPIEGLLRDVEQVAAL